MAFKLIVALVILCGLLVAAKAGRCPPIGYFWWSYSVALEGHTLKRYSHLPEGKCQVQCLKNPHCYSLNHKGDFSEGNCEINGATREMSPGSYRERLGWVYYEIKVKPYRTTLQLKPFNGWAIAVPLIINCSTNARPPADVYEFRHNGKLMYKGGSNIYTIAKVTMNDGGLYKCVPSNNMGRGEEASLNITVTDFRVSFPKKSVKNFVILRNVITRPLTAVTVCLWMRSKKKSLGTIFSYSTTAHGSSDEELSIFYYDDRFFYFWIKGGKAEIGSVPAKDGRWHHICGTWDNTNGTWAFYKDGQIIQGGEDLKTGEKLLSGGAIVLGQDQDHDGGGFEKYQSFAGEMTMVNIWSRVLTRKKILKMSRSCAEGRGDVMKWADVKGHSHGYVKELPPLPFPSSSGQTCQT